MNVFSNDSYGTSRFFARRVSSAMMNYSGNEIESVRTVGRSRESGNSLAFDQSMYSVESSRDQNSRSSSSLLNVGILFRVDAIDLALPRIHVSR